LILDDLMDHGNEFVVYLFTKISHHHNLSVVYVCQNLFDKSKYHRTISLNAHYIVLMRNPRDTQPVAILARQILAGDWRVATDAYTDATSKNIITYCSIYIGALIIICVTELMSFQGSSLIPILRGSHTIEQSVDMWTSSENEQLFRTALVELFFTTAQRISVVSHRLTTFFLVEIVLILAILLLSVAKRVCFKTNVATDSPTAGSSSAPEISQ